MSAIAAKHAVVVDLTADPKDQLSGLPSEILSIIFTYLLPNHKPDLAMAEDSDDSSPKPPRPYELYGLHVSCKRLQAETNSWAHHFLRRYRNITKYKDLKTRKLQANRNFFLELLRWLDKNCVFCGKKSSRNAILVNGFRCCAPCDKQQWPNKITKSDASADFDLKPHQLLPAKHLPPRAAQAVLVQIRYGTYMTSNVPTTMFLRSHVRHLARVVHGVRWVKHLRLRFEAKLLRRGFDVAAYRSSQAKVDECKSKIAKALAKPHEYDDDHLAALMAEERSARWNASNELKVSEEEFTKFEAATGLDRNDVIESYEASCKHQQVQSHRSMSTGGLGAIETDP